MGGGGIFWLSFIILWVGTIVLLSKAREKALDPQNRDAKIQAIIEKITKKYNYNNKEKQHGI
jgi:hypothetical protein